MAQGASAEPRHDPPSGERRLTRRGALRAAAAGAAGVALAAGPRPAAAQQTGQGPWRVQRIEWALVGPAEPVSITQAGGGPPQRGDWFYIDLTLHPAGGAAAAPIGTYYCFGAWTSASDDTAGRHQRLTVVQFDTANGSIMGLINEGTPEQHEALVGAIIGGTGDYTGAIGTFRQLTLNPPPGAVGRAVLDLMLPNLPTSEAGDGRA